MFKDFSEVVSGLGREYIKARLKFVSIPFIKVLKEFNIGKRELEFLVNHRISLYGYLPKTIRDLVAFLIAPRVTGIQDLKVTDDLLDLFIEAIADELPFFAEVIRGENKEWLRRDLSLLLDDVRFSLVRFLPSSSHTQ